MESFFAHWIENHHLVDLEPPKLSQTWRNGRKGDDLVTKRLDRFFIVEKNMENPLIIKTSILVGGVSDHMPILIRISKRVPKPLLPLSSIRLG